MERVVGVVRQLVDPHNHSSVHTQLVGPITITEKGVELECPVVCQITEEILGKSDMEKACKVPLDQNQLERLAAKKRYWIGRRICKDISGDIIDNMWINILSNMCQRIIVDSIIPEVVDRVAVKQLRVEKQT